MDDVGMNYKLRHVVRSAINDIIKCSATFVVATNEGARVRTTSPEREIINGHCNYTADRLSGFLPDTIKHTSSSRAPPIVSPSLPHALRLTKQNRPGTHAFPYNSARQRVKKRMRRNVNCIYLEIDIHAWFARFQRDPIAAGRVGVEGEACGGERGGTL